MHGIKLCNPAVINAKTSVYDTTTNQNHGWDVCQGGDGAVGLCYRRQSFCNSRRAADHTIAMVIMVKGRSRAEGGRVGFLSETPPF